MKSDHIKVCQKSLLLVYQKLIWAWHRGQKVKFCPKIKIFGNNLKFVRGSISSQGLVVIVYLFVCLVSLFIFFVVCVVFCFCCCCCCCCGFVSFVVVVPLFCFHLNCALVCNSSGKHNSSL